MQDKFQFRLNADIHGEKEAAVLYTATHDGGCYVVTWEDESGEGSTMYGDFAWLNADHFPEVAEARRG